MRGVHPGHVHPSEPAVIIQPGQESIVVFGRYAALRTEDADLWQEGAAQQSVAHSLHDRRPSTLVGSGLIGVHALAESAQQRVVGAHHLGVEPVHELSADLAVGRIVDSVRRLAGVGFQIEKFVCI